MNLISTCQLPWIDNYGYDKLVYQLCVDEGNGTP